MPGRRGPPGPPGERGAPGWTAFRVVTSGLTIECGRNEVLVSIVCARGAPDGASCPMPGGATGLCARVRLPRSTGLTK